MVQDKNLTRSCNYCKYPFISQLKFQIFITFFVKLSNQSSFDTMQMTYFIPQKMFSILLQNKNIRHLTNFPFTTTVEKDITSRCSLDVWISSVMYLALFMLLKYHLPEVHGWMPLMI